MENKPYWLKLLEHYSLTEKRTGLTIPFIIGSSDLTTKEFKKDNISSLLLSINDNSHCKVMLKYCGTIEEFILSVNPNLFYGSQYNMKKFNNLIVIQTNGLSGIDELEDIISALSIDYSKHIDNKRFSIINNKWEYYNTDEIKMIKNVLS